jgi:hypothetical protein
MLVGIIETSAEKSEICDSSFSSVEMLQTMHLLSCVYIGYWRPIESLKFDEITIRVVIYAQHRLD